MFSIIIRIYVIARGGIKIFNEQRFRQRSRAAVTRNNFQKNTRADAVQCSYRV